MNKEYRYRRHVHWGQYVLPIIFGAFVLSMAGISGYFAWKFEIALLAILPAVLGFMLLIEGGMIWYLYYRLAGTVISTDEDVLIYKNRKVEKRLPIESIYLEFSSIKYLGGWLKIRTDTDTIRLTVVLEDLSGLLQELKTRLDNKELSSHYDTRKLFGFLKTAVASDQSWERAYALFGKMILLILSIGISIFNGYIFGTIPYHGRTLTIVWSFLSLLWITIAYTTAEFTLMRLIAKKSDEKTFTFPARDPVYEKLVFDKAFVWGSITYFLFSSFILVLIVSIKNIFQP